MTDALTREHGRALLACVLFGEDTPHVHTGICRRGPPPANSSLAATLYSHPSVTRQASRLGQVNVPP